MSSKNHHYSPDCASHANGATLTQIEVNLEQLKQEINRIQDIAEEQVEFYNQYGKVNGIWLPDIEAVFRADAKAISIHLELLHELAYRLALTCLDSLDLQSPSFNVKQASSSKTVLIPVGDFVRSKDFRFDQLVDSEAELRANDETKRQFFEDHHINHHWYGSIPAPSEFLKNLYLSHNHNIRDISALASCSSLQV